MNLVFHCALDDKEYVFMGFSGGWSYMVDMNTGDIKCTKSGNMKNHYKFRRVLK